MSNNSSGDDLAATAAFERVVTIEELCELCESDALSLGALKKKQLPKLLLGKDKEGFIVSYNEYPFFHEACMNEKVTLEIIEYLLSIFPQVGCLKTNEFCPDEDDGGTESYPLHVCCYNELCPNEVIGLLVEKYPDALSHFCIVGEGIGEIGDGSIGMGLPLHYYLERESYVDIDTVKVLVEAYPEALMDDFDVAPIHVAATNPHIDNLLEIILYLLESEPSSIRSRDRGDATLLDVACKNNGASLDLFQLLYNAWPEALRVRSEYDRLPIHGLCRNIDLDETASIDILRFMLEIDPNLPREMDRDDYLPVHYAVYRKSTAFCKILIDAYPDSLQIGSDDGWLPIHEAFIHSNKDYTSDTIQYMLELDPELVNAEDRDGYLLIHYAAANVRTESIELLLKFDSDAASKEMNDGSRRLPLHIACSDNNTNLSSIQALYDAYPDAIFASDGGGQTPLDVAEENQSAIDFLQTQLEYAEQSQNTAFMATADDNGQLPLHRALKVNASLGSLKLLVMGNLAAMQVADRKGAYPVHIACEFGSVNVVKYLVELAGDTLNNVDANKDSPLHYACREGNLGVVKYLLERNAPSVSERNSNNKLPLHLLFECKESKVDKMGTEYIEVVWLFHLAYPEVVRDFMSC